ncbi:MAG: hypothetical protein ABI747_02050 [Candidatus Moraniibacteriota bacterium]
MPEEEVVLSPETSKPESTPGASLAGEQASVLESPAPQKMEQPSERVAEKYAQILSQVATTPTPVAVDVETDATSLSGEQDATATVVRLVTLAETKGVAHAVHVAQKLHDLYILDVMHDKLADELYEALKAKGLIEAE